MAGKADVLQQKSPAEFFAENKNIAGFDNVRADPSYRNNIHYALLQRVGFNDCQELSQSLLSLLFGTD